MRPTILVTLDGHPCRRLVLMSQDGSWKRDIAEFTGRDLHLVKKALAIAVLTIDRMPGPFQSGSDMTDMKDLLDRLIVSDVELGR